MGKTELCVAVFPFSKRANYCFKEVTKTHELIKVSDTNDVSELVSVKDDIVMTDTDTYYWKTHKDSKWYTHKELCFVTEKYNSYGAKHVIGYRNKSIKDTVKADIFDTDCPTLMTDYAQAVVEKFKFQVAYTALDTIYCKECTDLLYKLRNDVITISNSKDVSIQHEYESLLASEYGLTETAKEKIKARYKEKFKNALKDYKAEREYYIKKIKRFERKRAEYEKCVKAVHDNLDSILLLDKYGNERTIKNSTEEELIRVYCENKHVQYNPVFVYSMPVQPDVEKFEKLARNTIKRIEKGLKSFANAETMEIVTHRWKYVTIDGEKMRLEVVPYKTLELTAYGSECYKHNNAFISDAYDVINVAGLAIIELIQLGIVSKPSEIWYYKNYVYSKVNKYIDSMRSDRNYNTSYDEYIENNAELSTEESAIEKINNSDIASAIWHVLETNLDKRTNKNNFQYVYEHVYCNGESRTNVANALSISKMAITKYCKVIDRTLHSDSVIKIISKIIFG